MWCWWACCIGRMDGVMAWTGGGGGSSREMVRRGREFFQGGEEEKKGVAPSGVQGAKDQGLHKVSVVCWTWHERVASYELCC